MSTIYYYCCTHEGNDCPHKEECLRYINADTHAHTTLFKLACIPDNNYYLWIKEENNIDKIETKSDGEDS